MKKLITFAVLIFIILSACEDSPSGPDDITLSNYKLLKDQNHNVIMPLADSNRWEYHTFSYIDEKFDSNRYTENYIKIWVSKDTLGGAYFAIRSNLQYFKHYLFPYTNTVSGFVCMDCDSSLLIKYPAKKGDSYRLIREAKYPVLVKDTVTGDIIVDSLCEFFYDYKVISTDNKITTTCGNFRTILYELNVTIRRTEIQDRIPDLNFFKIEFDFAPDIGLIKMKNYSRRYNQHEFKTVSESVLTNYILN